MIGQEEFYMEIRKKWKSLYPAYFDKSKSIAEGNHLGTKVDECLLLWQLTALTSNS